MLYAANVLKNHILLFLTAHCRSKNIQLINKIGKIFAVVLSRNVQKVVLFSPIGTAAQLCQYLKRFFRIKKKLVDKLNTEDIKKL